MLLQLGGCALQWLCSQSRPDLSAQVNICQQMIKDLTVKGLRNINNTLRRAAGRGMRACAAAIVGEGAAA